jgi:hypothetical protein
LGFKICAQKARLSLNNPIEPCKLIYTINAISGLRNFFYLLRCLHIVKEKKNPGGPQLQDQPVQGRVQVPSKWKRRDNIGKEEAGKH